MNVILGLPYLWLYRCQQKFFSHLKGQLCQRLTFSSPYSEKMSPGLIEIFMLSDTGRKMIDKVVSFDNPERVPPYEVGTISKVTKLLHLLLRRKMDRETLNRFSQSPSVVCVIQGRLERSEGCYFLRNIISQKG
ncbi:hypothetical protein LOAG_00269 [Loa loa]|uniref:Uncharacterized protein n=1 Tax=Loa loa TaxID=7209 RepID=A0A1S0UBV6_LOALO|nr:hypothetical protein LOAG_00269 [Loa loa]EFO28211.1 hypothetical protein LOAG_00269 [Loa loa]